MSEQTLRRDAFIDEPGLVGARWWQDSVFDPVGRRTAITGLLAVGGVLGLSALLVDTCGSKDARRQSLDLQRRYGWDFGAGSQPLVFDGETHDSFDSSRLSAMARDLEPRVPAHVPFYLSTLFDSLTASPKESFDGSGSHPLASVLRPIATPEMKEAFEKGQASASSVASLSGVALVIDLPGPAAVAYAAAAATYFDPIFLFDNWPHPRGVVPAHLTLAAAAYYQPLFARAHAAGSLDARPMFVLDRNRLATYEDDHQEFDNRWVARLPSPAALKSLGVTRVVYVCPDREHQAANAPELDDLNDDFVSYSLAGISIATLDASSISGGVEVSVPNVDGYVPTRRSTPFSSSLSAGATPPQNFASVPVELSVLGGALLGIRWSRESRGWGRGGG